MKRTVFAACAVALSFLCAPFASAETTVIGWIEDVHLPEIGKTVKAKMDTGAKTSSIDIDKFELFEKDNKEWVRFGLRIAPKQIIQMERPLFRIIRVKRSGTVLDQRPVVLMNACLGGYLKETQFSLKKRTKMNYRMLIGRRFLRDKFAIASHRQNLSKPDCKGDPEPQDNAK